MLFVLRGCFWGSTAQKCSPLTMFGEGQVKACLVEFLLWSGLLVFKLVSYVLCLCFIVVSILLLLSGVFFLVGDGVLLSSVDSFLMICSYVSCILM